MKGSLWTSKEMLSCVIFVLVVALVAACAQQATPTPMPTKAVAEPAKPAATAAPVATQAPAAVTTKAPAPTKPAAVKPLDPPVAVKLGVAPQVSNSSVYIAQEKGYFDQEGLKVEFVRFPSDATKMPPLISGELDAGITLWQAAMFNAMARSIGVKVVAGAVRQTPGHGGSVFMVRKDIADQIKEAKDLRGRKISMIASGTAGDIFLDRALAKGGMTRADVEILILPAADQSVALSNKSIDVAVQTEPQATLGARQGISVKWKNSDEFYPNQEMSAWVYSEKFQKERPEAAKRFMVALLRGEREFIDAFQKNKGDRKGLLAIIMKNTGITDETLFNEMALPDFSPDGAIDQKLLANDLKWYMDNNLVQAKLDLNAFFDMQYSEYAISRLGKYQ